MDRNAVFPTAVAYACLLLPSVVNSLILAAYVLRGKRPPWPYIRAIEYVFPFYAHITWLMFSLLAVEWFNRCVERAFRKEEK